MPAGWQGFYYVVGTAQSLRFLALPQLACDAVASGTCANMSTPLGNIPAPEVAVYYFGVSPDAAWPSYGWLVLITAVIFCLSLAGYRFVNHTKR